MELSFVVCLARYVVFVYAFAWSCVCFLVFHCCGLCRCLVVVRMLLLFVLWLWLLSLLMVLGVGVVGDAMFEMHFMLVCVCGYFGVV